MGAPRGRLGPGLQLLAGTRLLVFGARLLGFGVPAQVPSLASLLLLAGDRLLDLGVRLLGLS